MTEGGGGEVMEGGGGEATDGGGGEVTEGGGGEVAGVWRWGELGRPWEAVWARSRAREADDSREQRLRRRVRRAVELRTEPEG